MRIYTVSLMAAMVLFGGQGVAGQGVAEQDLSSLDIDLLTPITFGGAANISITASVSPKKESKFYVDLVLAQGVAGFQPGSPPTFNKIGRINTLCIMAPDDPSSAGPMVYQPSQCEIPGSIPIAPNVLQYLQFEIQTPPSDFGGSSNYFLCSTADNTDSICDFYSSVFSIITPGILSTAAPISALSGVLTLGSPTYSFSFSAASTTESQPAITSTAGSSSTPSSGSGASVVLYSTVTTSSGPTATTTIPNPSDPLITSPLSLSASTRSSGLPVGAKVGIAVGAIALVLLVLLGALLCLRRAHTKRRERGSEQVMLNRSLHNDSRDLMAEKETSPASFETPTPGFASSSPTSITGRHSALSPYDSIPSQPYSGSAAAIPRRKPTTATTRTVSSVSAGGAGPLSRGVSSASSGVISPRTTTHAASSSDPSDRSHEFEEYHDVPVYGDTRHVPQVFNGGLQAPFLSESEEGLSGDEAARLAEEEEERRIDAAIAEAERAKGGGGR